MNAGGPASRRSGHSPPHDGRLVAYPEGLAAVLHMARAFAPLPDMVSVRMSPPLVDPTNAAPSDADRISTLFARRGGRSVSRPERGLRIACCAIPSDTGFPAFPANEFVVLKLLSH